MKIIKDVMYDNKNALDIYVPDNGMSSKTLVYVHGGGIESGDKYDHFVDDYGKELTDLGYSLVSINYSLYPNTKFPEYLNEAATSIRFVLDNAEKYGLSKNLYVSGSSAGAYMILMLCMNEEYLNNAGVNKDNIVGWISDDGQTTDHFNIQKFEGGMDPWIQRITHLSPIYYIGPSTKFSKMLVIYYDNDMPMRAEQNLLMVKTIKHFNNKADLTVKEFHGTHCLWTSNKDESGRYQLLDAIIEFMK